MGNRVFSGSTGKFAVLVFEEGGEETTSPAAIGKALYMRAGEYSAEYNVTTAGDYLLYVSSVR